MDRRVITTMNLEFDPKWNGWKVDFWKNEWSLKHDNVILAIIFFFKSKRLVRD